MSRLRTILAAQYAEHYARINASTDPAALPARVFKGMDAMYGPLLRRLPAGAKVLDLGCGTGFLLRWLADQPNLVPVGVDASPGQLAVAADRLPQVEIVCRDGLDYLREHPETFDGIFCIDVLEHVPGDDLLLEWVETAVAALTPGGFFVCRTPNAANLMAAHARYMDLTHQRCFTSASILQLLAAGGLTDCRTLAPRAASWSGRLRLGVETLLHRALFRVCSCGPEQIFTRDVCAVGFRHEGDCPDFRVSENGTVPLRQGEGDSPVFAETKTGTVPPETKTGTVPPQGAAA